MLIREAGIMHQGLPVIYTSYHRASKKGMDSIDISALLSGLLSFAETVMEPIEYFETDHYSIVVKNGLIKDRFMGEEEIVAFIVLDKDPRLERYLHRTILPLLERLLKKFIHQFDGCNLTRGLQFEVFKNTINKIFSTGTKTFEEKVVSLLV